MKDARVIKLTNAATAANRYFPLKTQAIIMINFEKKPLNGGTPEMESDATIDVVPVTGIA